METETTRVNTAIRTGMRGGTVGVMGNENTTLPIVVDVVVRDAGGGRLRDDHDA